MMDSVSFLVNNCTGNEQNLTDCAVLQSVQNCTSNRYSAVLCSSIDYYNHICYFMPSPIDPSFNFSNGHIQLINNPPNFTNMGIVQIYYNGSFGLVCDDGFTKLNADIICKQLGYNDGGSTKFHVLLIVLFT